MMDPREISNIASQAMGQPAAQIPVPAPTPDQLMSMAGPPPGQPPGMPPGPPPVMPPGMPPPMDPSMMPPGGMSPNQPPPKKKTPDLAPQDFIENVARYAADKSVQMASRLVNIAGPQENSVPANRDALVEIWNKRDKSVSDEQIAQWREGGMPEGEILAKSYPGRFALLNIKGWTPKQKLTFANQMDRLIGGRQEASPHPDDGVDLLH